MPDLFTKEEIRELKRPSDLRGALSVAVTWAIIAGSLGAAALFPHPAVILVAVVLIGGRQLGLAVLMHEASHRSLFRTRRVNDFVGRWLTGAPMWNHLALYREHHMQHHAYTNSDRDPDMALVEPFPVSRRSLARKLLRDAFGITGLKRVVGLTLMDIGVITYSPSGNPKKAAPTPMAARLRTASKRLLPVLLTNFALFAACAASGHAWVFLLWVGAYFTVFSLFLRIRSLAEHACTEPASSPRARDPLRNTRTTRAGLVSRLTVAPHHVNYHLEHHLLMTVPHYNLPRMHQLLRERGAVDEVPSYWSVLRKVSTPAPA